MAAALTACSAHSASRFARTRNRLLWTIIMTIGASLVAACGDRSSPESSADASQKVHPQALATSFNAGPLTTGQASIPSSSPAAAGPTLASDAVALAPPVIHTVD